MSGGDFINSGERQRLLQRGIEDRVRMVRDLRRIMDARGAESAALVLGCSGSGELFAIVERRVAIQAPLLEQLYGPRGGKLKDGLTTSTKPKGVTTPAVPKLPVAKPASVMTVAKVKPATAPPVQDAVRGTTRPGAAEAAEVLAIMKRASAGVKGTQRAATAMGMGHSTFYNALHGHKPLTEGVVKLVRLWAAANPEGCEQDAARVSNDVGDSADRAEGRQVPPPAPIGQDADAPGAAVALSDGGTSDDADAGAGVADSGEAGTAPPRALDAVPWTRTTAAAFVASMAEDVPPPKSFEQDAAAAGAAVVAGAGELAAAADAGAGLADRGEVVPPLDPPPAQDSTVALSVQLHPPEAVADLPRATVDGEAGLCLVPPPQTIEDPITAALAVLQVGIDAQLAACAGLDEPLAVIAAQISALEDRRAGLLAQREAAQREAGRLTEAKFVLQDLRA